APPPPAIGYVGGSGCLAEWVSRPFPPRRALLDFLEHCRLTSSLVKEPARHGTPAGFLGAARTTGIGRTIATLVSCLPWPARGRSQADAPRCRQILAAASCRREPVRSR